MANNPLQKAKDLVSLAVYGMTAEQAVQKGICISCHQHIHPLLLTAEDVNEYHITGLCPMCFKEAYGEDEPSFDA